MAGLRLQHARKGATCYCRSTNAHEPTFSLGRRFLTHSYVEGSTVPPLDPRTLSTYFKTEILDKHNARPALICKRERPRAHGGPPSHNLGVASHLAWDFQEFDRHIDALARGLLSMGIEKGDRVAVIMGNNSAYATLQWACARVGAILVTINPAYRLNELTNTLNLVGVKHLFIVPSIRTSHYLFMFSAGFQELRNSLPGDIQEPALPSLRNLVLVDNISNPTEYERQLYGIKSTIDWRELMMWREDNQEQNRLNNISESLRSDEVINLQFTSGTTGNPKAVSLTHTNILNNALSIARCMRLTPDDVVSRLVLGNLAAWSHGSCIVYPSATYEPGAIVNAVSEEKCTALHGVPTHFLGVLAEVEKRQKEGEKLDFSRLRTGIAAGSPIPIELMRQLIDKLNLVDLTNAYGMTETSPVSFQTTPADPILKRVETVGKVQPHVKAKVVDGEGNIVPIGKPGEIYVSGYLVQKGYWKDPEQTNRVMHGDTKDKGTIWMSTGDEGIMDEEGFLRIVGRTKDIIIRGGENLFPVQIENVLTAHPNVSEAAAVSVPDAKYGEVVGAWIVTRPDITLEKEEVRRFVAERMNPQNAPAWVWFVGVDGEELPKTASGKVMKHVLREWSRSLANKGIGMAYSKANVV